MSESIMPLIAPGYPILAGAMVGIGLLGGSAVVIPANRPKLILRLTSVDGIMMSALCNDSQEVYKLGLDWIGLDGRDQRQWVWNQ